MSIDIARYTRLPSLPGTAMEVIRLFHDPECSIDQLIEIIRTDPAIVSKLLKAANSAVYGARGEVTDLKRAVMMLGRKTVTPLVLSFSLASLSAGPCAQYFEEFWERSYFRATAAEVICNDVIHETTDGEAYTTSLLAGIGRLALLKTEPERTVALLSVDNADTQHIADLETAAFGFTHQQLSAALLEHMGLPQRVTNAVALLCPQAESAAVTQSATASQLSAVLQIADTIARFLCDGDRGASIVTLDESLERLSSDVTLTASELIERVRERVDVTAELFDIDSDRLPTAHELLQVALDQLSSFAVEAVTQKTPESVPPELLAENGRLKRRVADLLKVSHEDALTGIGNRQCLQNKLAERIAVAAIRKEPIGMAVVDIDHFKYFNDEYGHLLGDMVLKEVARALTTSARDSDFVARFGGEEFVILLESPSEQAMEQIGERYRKAVAEQAIHFDSQTLHVTASVGLSVANVSGDFNRFGKDLFTSADHAMYSAKQAGRNRVAVEPFRCWPSNMERDETDSLTDSKSGGRSHAATR
jgi:diguanylate cyclase (GGDEF)-like protein